MDYTDLFLSTPSARRATGIGVRYIEDVEISIHALREEGDERKKQYCKYKQISIHALREEGDLRRSECRCWYTISIHALREEGDTGAVLRPCAGRYFYPRPPRGGRRGLKSLVDYTDLFLSTPSARRATGIGVRYIEDVEISIHALREEGDERKKQYCKYKQISIHALREEGDLRRSECRCWYTISIHALREEGDKNSK